MGLLSSMHWLNAVKRSNLDTSQKKKLRLNSPPPAPQPLSPQEKNRVMLLQSIFGLQARQVQVALDQCGWCASTAYAQLMQQGLLPVSYPKAMAALLASGLPSFKSCQGDSHDIGHALYLWSMAGLRSMQDQQRALARDVDAALRTGKTRQALQKVEQQQQQLAAAISTEHKAACQRLHLLHNAHRRARVVCKLHQPARADGIDLAGLQSVLGLLRHLPGTLMLKIQGEPQQITEARALLEGEQQLQVRQVQVREVDGGLLACMGHRAEAVHAVLAAAKMEAAFMGDTSQLECDLHGQHTEEVRAILGPYLSLLRFLQGSRQVLRVITGQGKHSTGKCPVIKPVVVGMLDEMREWRYREDSKGGALLVTMG